MHKIFMSLLTAIALPTAVIANVDPENHKKCLEACDYAVCEF